ncbi:MAG: hypothetical protein BGO26_15535 [Actinobacteria bacterium 69-20]|nr:hypothetical protein [Actinomycetota bacterium]OJV28727.1 MAG: hypothetical protein BGO26_15535 [Actinobacteria bacterium 69-20]
MTTLVATAATAIDRLAAWAQAQPGDYDPTSGHGPEWGKAAPAGLLIWLFLGVALFFLVRSMNRHLRRVPKTFGDAAAESDAGKPPSMTMSSSDAGSGSDADGGSGDGVHDGSGDRAGDDSRVAAGAVDEKTVDD